MCACACVCVCWCQVSVLHVWMYYFCNCLLSFRDDLGIMILDCSMFVGEISLIIVCFEELSQVKDSFTKHCTLHLQES